MRDESHESHTVSVLVLQWFLTFYT